MKKVVVIVDNLEYGGVATVVKAFYQVVSKYYKEIKIDFIVYGKPSFDVLENYQLNGSKIIVIPSVGIRPLEYKRNIKKALLENGPYDSIHIHTAYFIWLAALVAKEIGIKNRIGHAHGAKGRTKNFIWEVLAWFGRKLNRRYCTKMFACAEKSGVWTFGSDFEFLPNVCIEKESKKISEEEYHKEFNISIGTKIIGYFGVFETEKNAEFLPKLMVEYKNDNSYVCVAGGNGSHYNNVLKITQKLNVTDKIKYLGYRKDGSSLMSFFNVLVVPSFSEGMSLSLLEAQMSGTPCVVSSGVPETNDLGLGLYYKVNDYDTKKWKEMIEEAIQNGCRYTLTERKQKLEQIGYDSRSIAKRLVDSYFLI